MEVIVSFYNLAPKYIFASVELRQSNPYPTTTLTSYDDYDFDLIIGQLTKIYQSNKTSAI